MNPSALWTTSDFPAKTQRQASAQELAAVINAEPDNEGICDGFRSPDEVIVRKRDSIISASYPIGDIFGLGSSVTSNFWLVPLVDLEQAMEAVDQAVLAAFPKGLANGAEDASLTGVWLDDGADVALVGCMGFGDWAAAFDEAIHEGTSYDWERATWLAFGGNDNGPHSLLESSEDRGESLAPSTLDLLFRSIVASLAQETVEVWQDEQSSVLAGWSPRPLVVGARRPGQSPG